MCPLCTARWVSIRSVRIDPTIRHQRAASTSRTMPRWVLKRAYIAARTSGVASPAVGGGGSSAFYSPLDWRRGSDSWHASAVHPAARRRRRRGDAVSNVQTHRVKSPETVAEVCLPARSSLGHRSSFLGGYLWLCMDLRTSRSAELEVAPSRAEMSVKRKPTPPYHGTVHFLSVCREPRKENLAGWG